MLERKSGFTLIELLVVIAIIAILAAILFPVFATAKANSQRAACLNNLKQIGTSLIMYCDDNSGRYPSRAAGLCPAEINPRHFDGNAPGVAALACWLSKYAKSPKIWSCPLGAKRIFKSGTYQVPAGVAVADLRSTLVGNVRAPGFRHVDSNYIAYPFNRFAELNGPSDPRFNEGAASGDCAQGMTPLEFYRMYGREWSEGGNFGKYGLEKKNGRIIEDAYYPGYQEGDPQFYPHKGGTTCVYYDGHAAWVDDPKGNRKNL